MSEEPTDGRDGGGADTNWSAPGHGADTDRRGTEHGAAQNGQQSPQSPGRPNARSPKPQSRARGQHPDQAPRGVEERDPMLAALLSALIPGAGQFLNGQVPRGAVILGVMIVYWSIGFLLYWVVIPVIGVITFGLGFLLWAFMPLWIVGHLLGAAVAAWDAHDQAGKINAGTVVV